MRKILKKWFPFILNWIALPTPKELGWTEYNGLGLRELTPFQEGKTWEDWDEYCKKHHPVKFFIKERIPAKFSKLTFYVGNVITWVKCHTLKKHRWHLLDLRGVDTLSEYTHGYLDPTGAMELAVWACLRRYIEEDKPENPDHLEYTEEEKAEQWYKDQKHGKYTEPRALYHYWMYERVSDKEDCDRLYSIYKNSTSDREKYYKAGEEWRKACDAIESREQEMFMRVCKIREYLWT